MRKQEEIEAALKVLARLINNEPRFHRILPGEPARQFALGVAAGLDYSKGTEVRPLDELLFAIRKRSAMGTN